MYRLALALSLFSLGGCAVAPAAPAVARPAHSLDSVWEVRTPLGAGSGSIIACEPDGDYWRVVVLTAKHVLFGAEMEGYRLQLTKGGVDLNYGNIVAQHPTLDAAILEFHSPDYLEPVAVRYSDPPLMSKCYGVGFSGGKRQQWTTGGHVSGLGRASIQGAPGDSGGAVLDESGALFGIIVRLDTWRRQLTLHHVHYVPLSALQEWISQH